MSSSIIGALTNATQTGATSGGSTPVGQPKKESERDMFMTLLVAQLKHQDPLAPQDGAQFVAQLAQFNSLDQLIGIRSSLEQLLAASQTGAPAHTGE